MNKFYHNKKNMKKKSMDLILLKDKIEKMQKNYHIEMARILIKDCLIPYDENKNGIFINLSHLSPNIHEKISKFIDYVELQENQLEIDEKEKHELKDAYFNLKVTC
jgi:hypothetical protein